MPDWFYRTVSRPLLFCLPPTLSRTVALGVMGMLGRRRLGRMVIDFLGHMQPDLRLRQQIHGFNFDSPVGIGSAVDGDCRATAALARFGIGFIEVGPITLTPHVPDKPMERRLAQQALWLPEPAENPGATAWRTKLRRIRLYRPSDGLPELVRLTWLAQTPAREGLEQFMAIRLELFPPPRNGWVLALPDTWTAEERREVLRAVVEQGHLLNPNMLLFLSISADLPMDEADTLVGILTTRPSPGVLVEAALREGEGRLLGLPGRAAALRTVQHLRQRWGDNLAIIGGGVHEPEDALHLVEAGADLVLVDAGLIYSGPGLPKRVNDVLLCRTLATTPKAAALESRPPVPQMAWFWTTLLGVSMFAGGILALVIAATRVVLPYDEAFVNLSRTELAAVNPRLLAFLTHDRVSLAGTMIAVGVLYLQLSLNAIRYGLHWARLTILCSSFAGFASFFLFLGFGYLEPFHTFVTVVLFQFLLFALYSNLGEPVILKPPNLREDWRWRANQWGQFLFVLHGVILLVAGLTISYVGITQVFVHEDLEFMHTTAAELGKASPRLLPLIAHDRATFGGMLIATGITVLLPALWGFRQGDAWLWWGLLGGGGAAYTAAIGVHLVVGYTNWLHLLPAFGGAALLAVGLMLSYPFLCGDPQQKRPPLAA